MLPHAIYVTGTDTAVGKTRVACALIHAQQRAGRRCAGMKPVASGCSLTPSGWRNDDAELLSAASGLDLPYHLINPYALPDPTAPEIAAERAGILIESAPIASAFAGLSTRADAVVVEGVGGWMAPLSSNLLQHDLVRELRLSVVLVVGLRLGCLNHALLSIRALRADGVDLLGWIGNRIDPQLAHADDYRELLLRHLDAPCLGWMTHDQDPRTLHLALTSLDDTPP